MLGRFFPHNWVTGLPHLQATTEGASSNNNRNTATAATARPEPTDTERDEDEASSSGIHALCHTNTRDFKRRGAACTARATNFQAFYLNPDIVFQNSFVLIRTELVKRLPEFLSWTKAKVCSQALDPCLDPLYLTWAENKMQCALIILSLHHDHITHIVFCFETD